MRGTSIRIGRILGIPIGIDITWFLSLAWVLWVLAERAYPVLLPDEPARLHYALAAISGLLFFVCIVLHELGHSVVARYFGIPVKSITLFVLGGVAQITREAARPLPEALMALAGPAVSILLGGVFMLLWLLTGDRQDALSAMWLQLWLMNLVIGVFNLIPLFPMDGGRVLRASLWGVTGSIRRATQLAVWLARLAAAALIVTGVLAVVGDVLPFPVEPTSAIWMGLIGLFLLQNANASLRQTNLVGELARHRVGDAMLANLPTVLADAPVSELTGATFAPWGGNHHWALVSGGEQFAGVVARRAALHVPEAARAGTSVRAVMVPAAAMQPIRPEQTLADALQTMTDHDLRLLPVVRDGEVVGLIHEGHINRMVAGRARPGAVLQD